MHLIHSNSSSVRYNMIADHLNRNYMNFVFLFSRSIFYIVLQSIVIVNIAFLCFIPRSHQFLWILLSQICFQFYLILSLGMTIVCATNEGLFARCRKWDFERIKFDFVHSDTGANSNLSILLTSLCFRSFFYFTLNF